MATAIVRDLISHPASEHEQMGALYRLLRARGKVRLTGEKTGGAPLELPAAVHDLLLQIVEGMQKGRAISVLPVGDDLTTQQAADVLGVSRPYFVKLLESGKLPYHLTGTHRRVSLRDVMNYREHRDVERHHALNRMAQEAERTGLYDRVLLPEE